MEGGLMPVPPIANRDDLEFSNDKGAGYKPALLF